MHTPRTPNDTGARRRTAAGVGVGLVAGAAIGLTMVAAPTSTAATDDTSVTTDAAVVAAPTQDGEPPEPGERLRESLQGLVEDGTITTEQADAVVAHLVEHRPERVGERHRGERFGGETIAAIIGIDVETLRAELRSGSSVADVAAEHGVDVRVVVDALVDEVGDHLQVDVENGRLTEDEAAERLADRTERIEAHVNGERPRRAPIGDEPRD